MPTPYRYTLQPYAGPASRYTCPSCERRRELARYLDTQTGELLAPEFGKCNRADSCGYHLSPYHPGPGGTTYAEQWYLDTRAQLSPGPLALARHRPANGHHVPTPAPAPRPVAVIPPDVLAATLGSYDRNNLARLLRLHFGRGVADELLSRFRLGTSEHWPGACVFWLIDERGRARGGQVVLYDETGHTVKTPRRCTTWAHTALAARCHQRGQPAPAWLADYAAPNTPKSPCLFGLPQLSTAPAGGPVAVVESAKTAVFCTPYLPTYTWLATMGKSYLTPDRLTPLRGRRICLFPDAAALTDWQRRAAELRGLGFDVTVSAWLETTATPAQLAAGYDLADLLLSQWPGYPPSWDEHG